MDVKCVICGEPWDYIGAKEGDMLPWEWKLFRSGAGCPHCKGVRPEGGGFEPKTIEDIEFGDEDPMIRFNAYEAAAEGKAPEWKRPEDKVLWTCNGCGVNVIVNADDGEIEYDVPVKSKAASWYTSHNFRNGTPEAEPAHTFTGDEKVCEFCLESCKQCDEKVNGQAEESIRKQEGMEVFYFCSAECLCEYENEEHSEYMSSYGWREFRDALCVEHRLSDEDSEAIDVKDSILELYNKHNNDDSESVERVAKRVTMDELKSAFKLEGDEEHADR